MQPVERKRKNQKNRWNLWLLAALLALAAVLILLRFEQEDAIPPVRQKTEGILLNTEPEAVSRATVSLLGRESWTVVQESPGMLTLEGEESWQVDSAVAERLLDALAHLEYVDILTENPEEWRGNLSDFGLEPARLTVEYTLQDGSCWAVHLGNAVDPEENAAYYMSVDGDSRLFAAPAGILQDLAVEKVLLHPVEQPVVHQVLLDRITVREGSGEVRAEWRLNGQVTDPDAGVFWIVSAPFEYPADEETISSLKDSAGSLRLGTYVGEANEKTLAQYGLTSPSAVLELHMAAGSTGTVSENGVYDVTDWPENTITLTFGDDRNDMTVYVLVREQIFTISRFSVSAFLDLDPLDTAARYPVLTPLDSLSSLRIDDGENTVVYDLDRSGQTELENTVHCLKNGAEISWKSFEAAYQRLLVVSFSGRLREEDSWGEPERKYTFITVSGHTHTVELSDLDGLHDAVTVDGYTLFYLIKGGMTELP